MSDSVARSGCGAAAGRLLERAIDFARGNEERVQKLIALKVKYETCAAPPATALR